jgi:lactoylglutathione lyase
MEVKNKVMTLEHVAIWTSDLERLKAYYQKYFGGIPNEKYTNEKRGFHSYFLSFKSGARLELMMMASIPANQNDTIKAQHLGIIHLAFGMDSMEDVDAKAKELQKDGYPILSGPRKTGDGYYEFETLDPDGNRLEVTTLFIEQGSMS